MLLFVFALCFFLIFIHDLNKSQVVPYVRGPAVVGICSSNYTSRVHHRSCVPSITCTWCYMYCHVLCPYLAND